MRRTLAALAAAGVVALAAPAVAHAQTPTTNEPDDSIVTSIVEQEVDVPVNSVVEDEDDDDDGGGNAGLFGLFGLLGLAGLAGLRRRHDDGLGPRTGTVAADTQARGATRHEP